MNRAVRIAGITALLLCTAAAQKTVLVEVLGNKEYGYTVSGAALLMNGRVPSEIKEPPPHRAPGQRYCTQLSPNIRRAQEEVAPGQKYYLYSMGRLVGTASTIQPDNDLRNGKVALRHGMTNVTFPLIGASRSDLGHDFDAGLPLTEKDRADLEHAALTFLSGLGHPKVTVREKQLWKRRLSVNGPELLIIHLQATVSLGEYPDVLLIAKKDQSGQLVVEFSEEYPHVGVTIDQLDVDHDGVDELIIRQEHAVRLLKRKDGKWTEFLNYSFSIMCT